MKKTAAVLLACLALAACSSDQPRIIQATSDMPAVRLTKGMATQIELPDDAGRVQSVVVGDPSLLTAEQAGSVVNLVPKEASGETNLIVRATDRDNDAKIYQYRVIIQER